MGSASELHPDPGGLQGRARPAVRFCTPGMMLASKALLERNPDPTEDDVRWALSGNLCRCTGYQNIVKAVLWAAREDASPSKERMRDGARRDQDRRHGGEPSPGRGQPVHPRARASTSTMSCCPACCTWRFCAARSPTPASSRSTPRAAWEVPGVRLVLTGEMMAARNLAWMPTLSYDTQAVSRRTRFASKAKRSLRSSPTIRTSPRDACEQDRRGVRAASRDRQPRSGEGCECASYPGRQGQPATPTRSSIGRSAIKDGTDEAFAEADVVSRSDCTTRARTRRRSSRAARSPTTIAQRAS